MSYLQKRIFQQMHLTPEQCSINLHIDGRHGTVLKQVPIFQSDQDDNILINVYDLDRRFITYLDEAHNSGTTMRMSDNDRVCNYQIKRFNPDFLAKNPDYPKYLFPKGKDTYPFFPPSLVEKFEAQQKIETLFLTEGYFKAMCASVAGMDIVGLGSITLFSDSRNKTLYRDIVRLIATCRPKNIVVLFDGDCKDLSKKAIEQMQKGQVVNLSQRPITFYNAIKKLRELLVEFKSTLTFEYVLKLRDDDPPKGVDDLLCDGQYMPLSERIVEDAIAVDQPGIFFRKIDLRSGLKRIYTELNLSTPQAFYDAWREVIGDNYFKFLGTTYQWNSKTEKLDSLIEADLENYIHVGNDFYLRYRVPRVHGDEVEWETELLERTPTTIKMLHGNDAVNKIAKYHHYEKFVNLPSHTDYQPIVHGCYNRYNELTYQPEAGDWSAIHKLLNHIFGPDGSDYYEMGLDYLKLMYEQPKQLLPVLCLVSKEQSTGKTTFLNLIKAMFGSNCSVGGNDMILSKFNSQVAGKLAICIDETSLSENQTVTEKIKQLSTGRTVMIEGKGKDQTEMENFLKIIMTSNQERKFIFASDEDIRFWVIKLHSLSKEELANCPNLSDDLPKQVPAFVHYLLHRDMFVKQSECRMWFAPERLDNEALRQLKLASKPMAERTLRDYLHDIFLDTGAQTLLFDLQYFREQIDDFRVRDIGYIRNMVELNLQCAKQPQQRVKMPFYSKLEGSQNELRWMAVAKSCRPYLFKRGDFVGKAEDGIAPVRAVPPITENSVNANDAVEDDDREIPMF